MTLQELLKEAATKTELSFDDFRQMVIADFKLACISRETSLLGRKEVLTGKAKFGIFGDGKEIPQLALAKVFQNGDFRSGYYRDQTFALAAGICTVQNLFAQLYADPNSENEPMSSGRQMNSHFTTRSLDEKGNWKNLTEIKNSSADASPTASQMPRSLGLALASKLYRNLPTADSFKNFSNEGNEISFVNIGDASTSEGLFWETLNAAGVMKVPLVISVWDDGFGISVPIKFQTTKGSISDIVHGFMTDENGNGVDIYTVNGWDYPALVETYQVAIDKTRSTQIPCLIHVKECTQPQGHSTSGSHERYKNKERLQWEKDFDGIKKMKDWMIQSAISSNEEIETIEKEAKEFVLSEKKSAWNNFIEPIKNEINSLCEILDELISEGNSADEISSIKNNLNAIKEPFRRDAMSAAKNVLYLLRSENSAAKNNLIEWISNYSEKNVERYNTFLHSHSEHAALKVEKVKAEYADDSPLLNGFEILNKNFDEIFSRNKNVVAFGEDLGYIGDVNQGFAGLQEKYGELRVSDTGIREATIIGQGIGLAMRGFRPIAEIQYLDYLLYGLQPLSDDLATLHYRTKGIQKAPVIVRTRGHRLEGIWHTGSPMGMMLHSLRGIYILTPRNMVQAAGFYNTMLKSDDPAIIVECLNGYRLKEKLPTNIADFTVPIGVPEILKEGNDVTIVSYGSTLRIIQEAIEKLEKLNISCELIDVQSLLPFDVNHAIVESVKKTNRVVFIDEDVPGGATAFMLQKVLEEQNAYQYLDSKPKTISAKAHRSAYASDGDYWSKPNAEEIFEEIYNLMHEAEPGYYPPLY